MKTYKIDDIFSEKVDKGSLFVLRTKDCLYYDIFVSYDSIYWIYYGTLDEEDETR